MIGNAVTHERIDEAAQAAAEADRQLAVLRTDLTDIASLKPTGPQLQVGAGLKFADIFFNSIFTDLAVDHQIRQAQDNIDRSIQLVGGVRTRLADQIARAQAKLTAIEAQRQELLTSQLGHPRGPGA
jgi:prefoldin subunit 5